jgi:hypothetical protein
VPSMLLLQHTYVVVATCKYKMVEFVPGSPETRTPVGRFVNSHPLKHGVFAVP